MWNCKNCGEEHEEQFTQCWKCGADRVGVVDPSFAALAQSADEDASKPTRTPNPALKINCVRCQVPLEPGYLILDQGESAKLPMAWCKGEMEKRFFGSSLRVERLLTVTACRCPACGHLELVAPGLD